MTNLEIAVNLMKSLERLAKSIETNGNFIKEDLHNCFVDAADLIINLEQEEKQNANIT